MSKFLILDPTVSDIVLKLSPLKHFCDQARCNKDIDDKTPEMHGSSYVLTQSKDVALGRAMTARSLLVMAKRVAFYANSERFPSRSEVLMVTLLPSIFIGM
jgi:hypothetical protein